ncbi:phage major capsid protein [Nonomuraea sp. NPDC049400]|uniref:phage major capsid protein n=1 Tax=Nonomuraea sp. NPDC049400 TaxID=3364352 RepID=UPI0037AACA39
MNILDQLRDMPQMDILYASSDDLLSWKEQLRSVQSKSFEDMKRIRDAAGSRALTRSQEADFNAAEANTREASTLLEQVDDAIDRKALDRSQIIVTGSDRPATSTRFADGVPLRRDDRVTDFVQARGLEWRRGDEQLDLGKYLRGLVLGEWEDADAERRAMSEGTQSAGGYMVPTLLSAQIIDLARNQTRVLQAGARIVPMANKTVDIAKWTGDPTAAWHTENATISPTDATLGKATLTAQALTSLTVVSRELVEDAPNVGDELAQAFAAQFALTLDRAALYGSGTAPEPRGVKNTSGITTQLFSGANGGTPTNYDFLIDAVGALEDNNEEATGVIYAPRTKRVLGKLKEATTNAYLAPPAIIAGLPRYDTNQVPINLTVGTSTDTSDAFVGNWRQLYVGVRTQLMIKPLEERYADNGQLGFLAWWRGDVVVARAKAFTVVTGLRG